MNSRMNRSVVHTVIVLGLLAACARAPARQVAPVSYSFVYEPPNVAPKSLPVTIALVHPTYADPAAFASSPHARQAGSAFVSSMNADLEKMLVAKGFRVTGPYESINVMTFPDKKSANLTLTPIVDVRATEQITRRTGTGSMFFPYRAQGVCVVSGWVSLVMLEPLTGEKIWIKKVQVSPVQEPFVWTYRLVRSRGQIMARTIEDTRGHALAATLNRIYPEVMQKSWDYFHPEEVLHMKQQAEEARKLKRY